MRTVLVQWVMPQFGGGIKLRLTGRLWFCVRWWVIWFVVGFDKVISEIFLLILIQWLTFFFLVMYPRSFSLVSYSDYVIADMSLMVGGVWVWNCNWGDYLKDKKDFLLDIMLNEDIGAIILRTTNIPYWILCYMKILITSWLKYRSWVWSLLSFGTRIPNWGNLNMMCLLKKSNGFP